MGVVTISATYGAGGSQLGPATADPLGLPFVDRGIPPSALPFVDRGIPPSAARKLGVPLAGAEGGRG
jgi:hypothetical protein